MKNPEEIYNNIGFQPVHKEPMILLIAEIQKNAYNQALLDVENITPEGWISIVEVKKLKIK